MSEMSFTLKPGEKIRWPNKCAYCGGIAEDEAPLSNTAATAYYGIAYKEETFSTRYPVCKKHKKICMVLNWPASLGFISTFIISIFLPGILWVSLGLLIATLAGVKGEALSPIITVSGYVLYAGMIIYLIIAAVKKPVKILREGKNKLSIRFRNKSYFEEFKLLNN